MLDFEKPQETLEALIYDFIKDVSWNRNSSSSSHDCSSNVLGQTVRLNGLEKRPELNGKCGVCVGYDQAAMRYLTRLNLDGIETDLSLREQNITVLKPKLVRTVVQIKGL